ncbi:MAG TPA: hypothetical protein VFX65_08685 [Candidatus Limnocylindrales bacterium]|nr:hypothetical protein [Candidatus Limnocylindrales bacterium]
MPAPTTPEPPDATPDGGDGDLAAVPAFLRARAGAAGRAAAPARAVGEPQADGPALEAAALPMPGIAPRRLVLIAAGIVLAWVLVSFGRQVAEASAASARADELRAANAALRDEVAAMEEELETIQGSRYIDLAARAYRLGTAQEIPFALAANAPPLAADAPGSASVRLGADTTVRSPIDSWLDVLFGPDD